MLFQLQQQVYLSLTLPSYIHVWYKNKIGKHWLPRITDKLFLNVEAKVKFVAGRLELKCHSSKTINILNCHMIDKFGCAGNTTYLFTASQLYTALRFHGFRHALFYNSCKETRRNNAWVTWRYKYYRGVPTGYHYKSSLFGFLLSLPERV